eukprot:4002837-Pyramimonas_sp.AAC.1
MSPSFCSWHRRSPSAVRNVSPLKLMRGASFSSVPAGRHYWCSCVFTRNAERLKKASMHARVAFSWKAGRTSSKNSWNVAERQ